MRWWTLAVAAGLLLAGGGAESAPDRDAMKQRAFQNAKWKILVEAAQEHVKLGLWCRDAGLVPQATAEFLRAAEVSEGKMRGVTHLVDVMRALDDKFWKTVQKKPRALLDTYEKKAKEVESDHEAARFRVAKDAKKAGLDAEAYEEFAALVRQSGKPLKLDEQWRVVLDVGVLPEDVSSRMRSEAIAIHREGDDPAAGTKYLKDDFLRLVPSVRAVYEADGERLRVRTTRNLEEAKDLLACCSALFPFLEEDTEGRPTKKMQLFVFGDRASWKTWCEAAGRPGFALASGLADGPTFTAMVCAEGVGGVEAVRGMALHELSHLYQYGVTPVVMPSWYSEGFAETYGGEGTFAWDGKTLTAGGIMAKGRLEAIRSEAGYIPLSELLGADALQVLTKDKGRGMRFYAESWALRRYLRSEAPLEWRTKFRQWEIACRGAALGANWSKPREEDTAPAGTAFERAFGSDVPRIEEGFRAWLSKL